MLRPVVAKRGETKNPVDERIFIKDGFRSYRRTYNVNEAYWGVGTGAVLLGIVGWVTWRGAHPDPNLFDMSAALQGDPAASDSTGTRGPLPTGLASGGFREGKIGRYSTDDLYVKINGRAGFFQSFGVKSLHTLTLEASGAPESAASIDIELYDMGESRNAIGVYNGERPPGVASLVSDGSSFHFDRNAAFLARGPYYIRLLGSDESAPVLSEVRRLLELFRHELAGEALPWAYALFVDQLKLSPSVVSYVRSNAFSFGFASDVYQAALSAPDSKEDTQAFVVASADPSAALALAREYEQAFGSQGVPAGKTSSGVALFKDEFLGSVSGARAAEHWVVGVAGAADAAAAEQILERLAAGLAALPPEARARAVPSTSASAEPGGNSPTTDDGSAAQGSAAQGSAARGSAARGSAAQGSAGAGVSPPSAEPHSLGEGESHEY
jgi:hypothetical protein